MLCHRLDLAALLRSLVTRGRPWPLDEALAEAALVARPGEDIDAHQLLATLMYRQPLGLLEALDMATSGPSLTPGQRHELASFLLHVAAIYRPPHAYRSVDAPPAPFGVGLAIDDSARSAVSGTLVSVAKLVAITQPAGSLHVVAARLEAALGRYERRADGGLIVVDLRCNDIDVTFAHELGHALDPAPNLLVALEERERFADGVGALLVERSPSDLAAVYAVVAEVLAERPAAAQGADAVLDDVMALAWYIGFDLNPAPALASLKG